MSHDSDSNPQVAVFALGNILMADDAVGPHVIARLQAGWEFPETVKVEDLGTPGLDLHPHLAGPRRLILVDAVRAQGEPGELRCYRKDEILRVNPGPRVSPHDPGLRDSLLALEFAGTEPEDVLLVGIIVADTGNSVGLTPAVSAGAAAAVRLVLDELESLGCAATPRAEPLAPNLWWEEEGAL